MLNKIQFGKSNVTLNGLHVVRARIDQPYLPAINVAWLFARTTDLYIKLMYR